MVAPLADIVPLVNQWENSIPMSACSTVALPITSVWSIRSFNVGRSGLTMSPVILNGGRNAAS